MHMNSVVASVCWELIEDLALDLSQIDRPPMDVMITLNIDSSAFNITGSRGYLSETYRLLMSYSPIFSSTGGQTE